jgi:hypothetical protein
VARRRKNGEQEKPGKTESRKDRRLEIRRGKAAAGEGAPGSMSLNIASGFAFLVFPAFLTPVTRHLSSALQYLY